MLMTLGKYFVFVYLLAFSALITYLVSDYFFAAQVPLSITLDKKQYVSGETLRYTAKFIRQKACAAEIQRFIVRQRDAIGEGRDEKANDLETVHRDQIIGLIVQGVEVVTTKSPMPVPKLEPGHYHLRIFVLSHCSIIFRVDKYPDAEFEIVGE